MFLTEVFYSQLNTLSKYRNVDGLSGGDSTSHLLVWGTNPLSGLFNGGKREITYPFLVQGSSLVLNC